MTTATPVLRGGTRKSFLARWQTTRIRVPLSVSLGEP